MGSRLFTRCATETPHDDDARHDAWRTGRPNDPRPQDLDRILGNPPWERIRLDERAFSSRLDPSVSAHTRKDARQRSIAMLEGASPALFVHFLRSVADVEAFCAHIRDDPRLASAARGELNTYTLFTALAVAHLAPDGVVSLLVKSALCTTPVHRTLFRSLLNSGRFVGVHEFINTAKIFPIDSRDLLVASACSLDAEGLAPMCRIVPPARTPAQISWLSQSSQWPEVV